MTYDLNTPSGQVRLIIGDTNETSLFSDAEILAFLALSDDNVKRAAASALDTIASNQTMTLKVIKLLDLETDGAAVARSLRAHAEQLRVEADELEAGEVGGLFDVAEMVVNDFTLRERVRKQNLRGTE